MPWMPGFNTPLNMAVNGAGHTETEEEMKARIHKEVRDHARKMKINKIKSWIRWRTIYVPRRIHRRLWALRRYEENGKLSIQEIEDMYPLSKSVNKITKDLQRELDKCKKGDKK